jgi:hypothetical protein
LNDAISNTIHSYDQKRFKLSSLDASFLMAKIIDWTKTLIVLNDIYASGTATTGFSIGQFT